MKWNKTKTFALAICMTLMTFSAAHALLMGNTVNYQYYFPNLSSPYSGADNGNKLVGAGVEVSNFVDNRGTMDISDTNILMDFTSNSGFSSGSFNGWVLTDVFNAIDAFTSVSINGLTNLVGLDLSRISFDADSISVNFAGLRFNSDTFVSLDVNSSVAPVPEPSTVLLLGSGLAGLAWYGRKRKKV